MTGLIILAAGQSARMGKPKQKLLYQGNSLLQLAIQSALASVCQPVIVVLGAFADEILPDIEHYPIHIIRNKNWEEGMASSIRSGIIGLENSPDIDNVLIMLCDQPHVDASLLNSIAQKKQQTGKGIVACTYNNILGVPVLFNKRYFAELLLLSGHEGAKKILAIHPEDIETIPFPLGAIDIDTLDDYNRLRI